MTELFDPTSYRYVLRIDHHFGPDYPDYWEGLQAIFETLDGLTGWLTAHGFVSTGYGYQLQTPDRVTTIYVSIIELPYVAL